MNALDGIDTIVHLMLENRSFDHILGHLSFAQYANGSAVDGLKAPLQGYENFYQGVRYYPFPLRDGQLAGDLPHERGFVATQLAYNDVTGVYGMSGFAEAYLRLPQQMNRTFQLDPMGFFGPEDVPITRFLADNFAVCDRWFASLPASTQPNRCMATSGTSRIDDTTLRIIPPHKDFVLDWLEANHVRWRVYHSGISFFLLFGRDEVFGPNFRSIARLGPDIAGEKDGDFPQVIFVEPAYGDSQAILGGVANDNHPPLPLAPGEALLKTVYEALTVNPARWARLLWVITYDEHGGFFDHVEPPPIGFKPASNAKYKTPFDSLGIRVPSLLVSPQVGAKQVFSETLDHTSFLQLLAEKFSPGKPYSAAVNQRSKQGTLIKSLSGALAAGPPRTDRPKAPPAPIAPPLAAPLPPQPKTALQLAFEDAARKAYADNPKPTSQQYPLVAHWALTEGKEA
jgi:phospholipase C